MSDELKFRFAHICKMPALLGIYAAMCGGRGGGFKLTISSDPKQLPNSCANM